MQGANSDCFSVHCSTCCQVLHFKPSSTCDSSSESSHWNFDLFGWPREGLANTVFEDDRFVGVWDALVHYRAIPITLHMSLETLMRTTPSHLTNLGSWQGPGWKPIKNLPSTIHRCTVHKVHKGVTQIGISAKIARKVNKVIQAHKAMLVQHTQKHLTGIVVWQVAQHDCGALLALIRVLHIFWAVGFAAFWALALRFGLNWLVLLRLFITELPRLKRFWYIQPTCQNTVWHDPAKPSILALNALIVQINEWAPHDDIDILCFYKLHVSLRGAWRKRSWRAGHEGFNVTIQLHSALGIAVAVWFHKHLFHCHRAQISTGETLQRQRKNSRPPSAGTELTVMQRLIKCGQL